MSLHHSPGVALDLAAARASEEQRAALARRHAAQCRVHDDTTTDLPQVIAPWAGLHSLAVRFLALSHRGAVPAP